MVTAEHVVEPVEGLPADRPSPRTASIYRRYAISDTAMLQEAGEKLASFHAGEDKTPTRKVVEITR